MRKFRRLLFVAALSLIVVLVLGRLALPCIGRRLIHTDPLQRADVIVVLGSYRMERTLEAGSLFQEGWSPEVLLLRSPDVSSSGVLRRLHITVPVWLDIQKSALSQMSVPPEAIQATSRTADTTRTEAELIADYAHAHGYRRVIVVTSAYHSERARRLIRKAAAGSFDIIMRADRYQRIDPAHWWRRGPDRNDVLVEYLKSVYGLAAPFLDERVE